MLSKTWSEQSVEIMQVKLINIKSSVRTLKTPISFCLCNVWYSPHQITWLSKKKFMASLFHPRRPWIFFKLAKIVKSGKKKKYLESLQLKKSMKLFLYMDFFLFEGVWSFQFSLLRVQKDCSNAEGNNIQKCL